MKNIRIQMTMAMAMAILLCIPTFSNANSNRIRASYSNPEEVLNRLLTPVEEFINPGCLMFQIRRGDLHSLISAAGYSIQAISMKPLVNLIETPLKTEVIFKYRHHSSQDSISDKFVCYERSV